jgi:nucleoside-diphosphate-sugar epimerase
MRRLDSPSGIAVPSAASDPDCGLIVTGASGWIGRMVVHQARSMGHTVVTAGRGPHEEPATQQVRFDLYDDEKQIALALQPVLSLSPHWALIHCAGLAHVRVETPSARELLQGINVDGTARLARACSSVGVSRFVYASSIAVYAWGSRQPQIPRTEMDPTDPCTTYGKTKLGGERVLMQSTLDWRVARLATVFGPGDTANFLRLAKAIKRGRFFVPGRGTQRKSCIDVDTVARAIVGLATVVSPTHRLVNVAIPESPTLAEISCSLATACRVNPPSNLSPTLLRLAAQCGDLCTFLKVRAPLTTQDLERLMTATWVDSSRAAAMLPDLASATFAEKMGKAGAYYDQA